ncbi:MAG: DUF4340 domain-containing protein [Myxococcales bacterium]|nr:DUF4340 domain-containing protein [Myxococcales bacterium]
MTTTQKALIAAFLVQLAIVPLTWRRAAPPAASTEPLLSVDSASVTELQVESSGSSAQSVTLRREGEGWVVASADGYPAKSDAVDSLIGHLGDVVVDTAPIATQAVSHEGLNVADADFGRRVTITSSGATEPLVFVLGQSDAGGINLRRGGDEVFSARGATIFDLKTSAGDYVERDLISFDAGQLDSLSVTTPTGTVMAQRSGGGWEVAGLAEGRATDSDAVDRVAGALATLRMSEPVAAASVDLTSPAATVSWTGTDATGTPFGGTLRIGAEDSSYRVVRLEGAVGAAKVYASSLSSVVDATIDAWSKEAAAAPVLEPGGE